MFYSLLFSFFAGGDSNYGMGGEKLQQAYTCTGSNSFNGSPTTSFDTNNALYVALGDGFFLRIRLFDYYGWNTNGNLITILSWQMGITSHNSGMKFHQYASIVLMGFTFSQVALFDLM